MNMVYNCRFFYFNFTVTVNQRVPSSHSNNYIFIYFIPLMKCTLINVRALYTHNIYYYCCELGVPNPRVTNEPLVNRVISISMIGS